MDLCVLEIAAMPLRYKEGKKMGRWMDIQGLRNNDSADK